MIDKLIEQELEYFKPMLERQKASSPEQSALWRQETIRQRQERVSLETYEICGGEVQYGPFRGLKLNQNTWWGRLDLGSQCLGLYEKEILNFIADLPQNSFSNFIDIGAADGYYTTGMLHSRLVEQAVCFEISEEGQQAIKQNWQANGSPGSLVVYGEANAQQLAQLSPSLLKNSLVLIDIEGAEFDFLTGDVIRLLSQSTVIVEVHNWAPSFEEKYPLLLRALANYFAIECMAPVERSTLAMSELRSFTDDNRLLLTSERRPCMMRFLKLSPLGA